MNHKICQNCAFQSQFGDKRHEYDGLKSYKKILTIKKKIIESIKKYLSHFTIDITINQRQKDFLEQSCLKGPYGEENRLQFRTNTVSIVNRNSQ